MSKTLNMLANAREMAKSWRSMAPRILPMDPALRSTARMQYAHCCRMSARYERAAAALSRQVTAEYAEIDSDLG